MKILLEIIKENLLYAIREKTFYLPLILYIILTGFFILNKTVFNTEMLEDTYVSITSTLAYFFTIIPVLYLSISSIRKDIVNKTIYFTLKSVNRKTYLIGKILSLILISSVLNTIFVILFYLGFLYMFGSIDLNYLYIFGLAELEYIILILATILFSFITTSIISSIFYVILFIFIGHTAFSIKMILLSNMVELSETGTKIINGFFYMLPNLEAFNVKDMILFTTDLSLFTFKSIAYFLLLFSFLSFLVIRSFEKKDL